MNKNRHDFEPGQIIFHIPHSSTFIPDTSKSLFYLNEGQFREEILRMTDLYTDELFQISAIPEENRLIFPYSRLICDVERFRDDSMEAMARIGMGMCYEMTSSLKPLKRITDEHRRAMLELYDRHHLRLTEYTDRVVKRYGTALIIDCHSFASERLPYEAARAEFGEGADSKLRPDICIGTDPGYHTPDWLRDRLIKSFECSGYQVSVNDPFFGTMVPMRYYHRDRRLFSVMIEVNRRLYMDERTGEKTDVFAAVRMDIETAVRNTLDDRRRI